MYTYGELTPNTIGQILELYSQEDIFKIVFGEYPDYNKSYLSPFRKDRNPNCFFDWYKGKLYFKDYADVPRDCFLSVKEYYNLESYNDVFEVIHSYFKEHKPLNKVQFQEYREQCESRQFYDITDVRRKFELRDNLFWKQYYITEEQLNDDIVYPISRYRFYARKKKKWITLNPLDIAYSISGFNKCKKIYRPKNKGQNKWLTNCSNNEIGNLWNISKDLPYLTITKSYKDCRVIRNDGMTNTVWFQSEGQFPDDNFLLSLIKDFPFIIIFYDNDEAGIVGAKKLELRINTIHPEAKTICIHSPFKYFKDPASIVSNKSREALHEILWKNCQM